MVRRVIIPSNSKVAIELPAEYIGKQVEILAFSLEEPIANNAVAEDASPMYASQKVLAKDWLTEEEDKAWQSL